MSAKKICNQISLHQTLNGTLEVNWLEDYSGEFCCPECRSNRLCFEQKPKALCKLYARCIACNKSIYLTCPNKRYSFRYQEGLTCPNPLCRKSRPENNDQEWIFLRQTSKGGKPRYQCRWCGVNFVKDSKHPNARTYLNSIKPFRFENDDWDLRNFYERTKYKTICFEEFQPRWYKEEVKRYIYQLLQSKAYASGSIHLIAVCLRKFGKVVAQSGVKQLTEITHHIILAFTALSGVMRYSNSN